ncbi:MAG: hypothetical protein ACK5MP_08850 [Nostocoides sp.]
MPQDKPAATEPRRPVAMDRATRLMRLGAGLTVISLVVGLAANGIPPGSLPYSLIGAATAITLWMWMADATGAGQSWARAVAVGLFGLNVLLVVISFFAPVPLVSRIFSVALLVVGAAAVTLLFSEDATEWFRRHDSPVR